MSESNVNYKIYRIVPRVAMGAQSEYVLQDVHVTAANPEEAEDIIVQKFDSGSFTYIPVISL